LLLVLDSNEYIFGFGLLKEKYSKTLLSTIQQSFPRHTIRIPRVIVEEVRTHLSPEVFKEFILFINTLTSIDENSSVSFEIGVRYEMLGFKSADAFISAYTEWVGASVLVTENRHFLSKHLNLPFRVLTAQKILLEL
jgi:hypothetical protein